jgi:hypothetical protein
MKAAQIFVQHEMEVGKVQGTGMYIGLHVLRMSARSIPEQIRDEQTAAHARYIWPNAACNGPYVPCMLVLMIAVVDTFLQCCGQCCPS